MKLLILTLVLTSIFNVHAIDCNTSRALKKSYESGKFDYKFKMLSAWDKYYSCLRLEEYIKNHEDCHWEDILGNTDYYGPVHVCYKQGEVESFYEIAGKKSTFCQNLASKHGSEKGELEAKFFCQGAKSYSFNATKNQSSFNLYTITLQEACQKSFLYIANRICPEVGSSQIKQAKIDACK